MKTSDKYLLIGGFILYIILIVILTLSVKKVEGEEKAAMHKDAEKLVQFVHSLDPKKYEKMNTEKAVTALGQAVGEGKVLSFNATLAFQMVNFFFLFILLKVLLWKPLTNFLDSRSRGIKEDLESARKAKEDAEQLNAVYQQKLGEAHSEVLAIKEQGRKEGLEEKSKIIEEARVAASKLLDDGRQILKVDIEEAQKTLRGQVADVACSLAEKILDTEVDKNKHRELISKFTMNLN